MTRDLLQEEQKESRQDWNWNSQDLIIQKKIWGFFNVWFLPRNLWTRLKDADNQIRLRIDQICLRQMLSDQWFANVTQFGLWKSRLTMNAILMIKKWSWPWSKRMCVYVYVYCIQENDHWKISSKHSPLERLA